MSSIVSRSPPLEGSTSQSKDRRWMSIRLGTSRGFCRRANERRTRVVSAAAKAATPQEVENGQIRRRAPEPVQVQARPARIARRSDAPLGRSTLTDPARAPAYVARAPFSGRLRLSADGGSVDGP